MKQKILFWFLIIICVAQYRSKAQEIITTTNPDCSVVINSLKDDYKTHTILNAERMPEIKGGDKQLEKLLVYYDSLERKKYSGIVYLGMIVTADGNKECIKILKGVNPIVDKEALRILSQLEFLPALQLGNPIPHVYHFWIDFNKAKVSNKKKRK